MIIDMKESGTKGGQGIRILISLLLTEKFSKKIKEITINNIRYDRPKPGLHDQLVQTLECIKKSSLLIIEPFQLKIGLKSITLKLPEDYQYLPLGTKENPLNIESRGSSWLILQNFLIPILSRTGFIRIKGNIVGPFAPSEFSMRKLLRILGINDEKLGNQKVLKVMQDSIELNIAEKINIKPIDMETICNSDYIDEEDYDYFYNIDSKSYQVTVGDYIITEYDKNRAIAKIKYQWQIESLKYNGLSGYIYDQILPFIILYGGKILIYKKTFDKMEEIDPHYLDLEILFENFGITKNISDKNEYYLIKYIKNK